MSGLGPEAVAHVVGVALTPVFLLSALVGLLNVFAWRLARVVDHIRRVRERPGPGDAEGARGAEARSEAEVAALRRRARVLDAAVVLAALAIAATCGATLALFVGALRDTVAASALFALFGAALLFAIAGVLAFLAEVALAWRDARRE